MSVIAEIGAAIAAARRFLATGRLGPARPDFLRGATLSYESDGRSGYVHFRNGKSEFRMYYEFGGGKALAVIDVPDVERWVSQTALPLERRDPVLRFIAEQVIADQTSSGRNRYEISGDCITIFV